MSFSYLTAKNVFDRYQVSKDYTEKLTDPFPEFERISRNKPHDGIDSKYPKTTDGTTASIIRKTPKRVVQQLPTGVVESDDEDDWLPIIAQFVYQNKILPFANEEYDLIQKCWTNIEKSLTFGYCATYTPFLNHDGYFCPDVTSPYWGDIFVQPGKKSGYSSSYVFMRAWWQKEDVEALIDKEKKLAKSAKARGEQYDSSWDLAALEECLEAATMKDDKASTPSEEARGTSPEGIELVTGFQKGIGAKFLTFNPLKKVVVRTKVNKDPRGKMPIDWLYGDTDGSNPLGRGIVELIGGLQNLIDSDMQMYQYNRALLLAPPVLKRGNFNKNKIVYEPNRIIDVGDDPNADVVPLKIDSTAIAKYPELYGLQKSQLLNLVNSPDTSISADVGNPGFSKTPAGINQQKATISVDDNYIRKMFEAWFENWSETAINIYFAERSGIDELQLDKETAGKLRKLAAEGKFDPRMLSEDNKIRINYDTATPALKFRVDASTSKIKDDSEQLEAMSGLLDTLNNNQLLQAIVPQDKIIGAWNSIVAASGVENPEELTINLEEYEQQQAEAQQAAQPEVPVEPPKSLLEQLGVKFTDLPEDIKQQIITAELGLVSTQPTPGAVDEAIKVSDTETRTAQAAAQMQQPEDQSIAETSDKETQTPQEQPMDEDAMIVEELKQLGLSDDVISRAIELLDQGATEDQVLEAIGVTGEQYV